REHGGIVTDLDGTCVCEAEDKIVIETSIAIALKALNETGRAVVINSLRFPLNVINTFRSVWADITAAPLPLVSLNGALIAQLHVAAQGFKFEEIAAFPVSEDDIRIVIDTLERLIGHKRREALLFIYPRDWLKGELIWAAEESQLPHVREKYKSASKC